MSEHVLYDCIGVGIGPFNLGLAALLDNQDSIKAIFFDKAECFEWHPGMLIEEADLQVPFLADLVTFADPTSKYSFLNYVHKQNRLYQFYFFKRFDIPRREYNLYAKWVADQLKACHFQSVVVDVKETEHNGVSAYQVTVHRLDTGETKLYFTKHVVLGTGSIPFVPESFSRGKQNNVVHTSDYLPNASDIKEASSVVVVGSGQSAAEVFYELLVDQKHFHYSLTWYTRSALFSQLETGKLGQEVFSPDYVHYFHSLDYEKRKEALGRLQTVRNGVDKETLINIYDLLYNRSVEGRDKNIIIQPLTEVEEIKEHGVEVELQCMQWETEESFVRKVEKVVVATGYKPHIPEWIWDKKAEMVWESDKEFQVDEKFRIVWKEKRANHIYASTNLEHSHGTAATNLSLAVMRNQTIINDIAGKELYPLKNDTVFQQFRPEMKN
ncbi:lysine N(6)-hydroxylase/L-ornithine N(5)-oxygenase family protein [Sutcliffiella halmapala]|uniref:lysine N(6)-hydroxylase/L-ornithine N(5)-oxygenase family protein n=1 Tax=Sutcliffiella halmapala TaxID=79882 RepID=UPI000995C6EB|nr:SidA/IucD/PvdA family monooxygenase [Sutcliffiella halmapala]